MLDVKSDVVAEEFKRIIAQVRQGEHEPTHD
jgi:hypothetical protein